MSAKFCFEYAFLLLQAGANWVCKVCVDFSSLVLCLVFNPPQAVVAIHFDDQVAITLLIEECGLRKNAVASKNGLNHALGRKQVSHQPFEIYFYAAYIFVLHLLFSYFQTCCQLLRHFKSLFEAWRFIVYKFWLLECLFNVLYSVVPWILKVLLLLLNNLL